MANKTGSTLEAIVNEVMKMRLREEPINVEKHLADISDGAHEGLGAETNSVSSSPPIPTCYVTPVYATPEQVAAMEFMASRPARKKNSPAWYGIGTYLDELSSYNSTKPSSLSEEQLPSTSKKRPTSTAVPCSSRAVTRSSTAVPCSSTAVPCSSRAVTRSSTTAKAAATSHLHPSTSSSGTLLATSSAVNEVQRVRGKTTKKRRKESDDEETKAKNQRRYQLSKQALHERMKDPVYAAKKREKWRAAQRRQTAKKKAQDQNTKAIIIP